MSSRSMCQNYHLLHATRDKINASHFKLCISGYTWYSPEPFLKRSSTKNSGTTYLNCCLTKTLGVTHLNFRIKVPFPQFQMLASGNSLYIVFKVALDEVYVPELMLLLWSKCLYLSYCAL